MGSEAPTPTVEEVEERAVYYETWAKDIRAMNGHSVDADHSDATARVLRSLRASLTRVEEERDALPGKVEAALRWRFGIDVARSGAAVVRDRLSRASPTETGRSDSHPTRPSTATPE